MTSSLLVNANTLRIPLGDALVHCIVTSPPYWSLRDYGVGGQLGLEKLHDCLGWARGENCGECYICHMRQVAAECWRVLRDDGTMWINIGDSYNANQGVGFKPDGGRNIAAPSTFKPPKVDGLKPKDLCMIPARLALALQADGWWLRSDIIWCLSGGAYVYARTQKGVLPMMVRDLARLDPTTVKLWNGEKWTQLSGMSRSKRQGDEVEIVLRSGERLSCTPTHKFPTSRGLLEASQLVIGDVIQTCQLPNVDNPRDCAIDEDAAWFAGLYLAEGSRSEDTIQIAGHSKEAWRWERVCVIAAKYGGSCTRTVDGNKMNIRVHGKILNAIIDELVTGRIAKDKGFSPSVWKYSNKFIASMLDGYLSGDGHYDHYNDRWRLGFTRNYNLERDLRTACARLGYHLTLKLSAVEYNGKNVPTFRGEIRFTRSGHRNEKDMGEVVEIRKSKCREVYDLGVEDEPHLFSLASGVLTHNSKPNPMPESVTDRPTKSHEYLFLFAKQQRYYFDQDAVREGFTDERMGNPGTEGIRKYAPGNRQDVGRPMAWTRGAELGGRNIRTVWNIATAPYSGAHFATYPPALVEPCVKAGTSERGVCPKCGKPWTRVTEKGEPVLNAWSKKGPGDYNFETQSRNQIDFENGSTLKHNREHTTLGWNMACDCNAGEPIPATVLDPFAGSGTTGVVCQQLNRRFIGLDLSYTYLHDNARERLGMTAWDAWVNGKRDGASVADLPLFGGVDV